MDHGSPPPDRLIPAHIAWDGDQPRSLAYDDIYHAPDGSAEVQRVFVAPNRLVQRFADREPRSSRVFRIGEIGFGTGLNFAVVAERFLTHAPMERRLHYVSFELNPIASKEFSRLAGRRARAAPAYAELARAYPPLLPGWHRRALRNGRVRLSLFFGAALEGLEDIDGRMQQPIDAWLLDGFAPRQNPESWSPAVIARLANLSSSGTTFATFTAAGDVRRRLEHAGFDVRRVDQRPHKRESLCGEFRDERRAASRARPPDVRAATVIGGGPAGSATARALADDGIMVRVIEEHDRPRNAFPGAVLHTRLLAERSARASLRALGYADACHWLRGFEGFDPCGVLQLPSDNMPAARLERIANRYASSGAWLAPVDSATASSLAGAPLSRSGLFFPDGGRVNLGMLARALLDHPGIERVRMRATAGASADSPVVLCTGADSVAPGVRHVWGQIDYFDGMPFRVPLMGDGHLVPLADGGSAAGATYEREPLPEQDASALNEARARAFLDRVARGHAPGLGRHVGCARGVRAVTRDRLPLVGQVAELFLNVAHGSHGLTTIPLAAACIGSILGGDFAPLRRPELAALDPARFPASAIRTLAR